MIYGVIYETTYLNTGERYIGQTTKTGVAFDNYFGSSTRIYRIKQKHGKSVLSKKILCECFTKEELNNMEKFYIKELQPELNISTGGTGGNLGPEVNKMLSENHANFKGENHPSWGIKRSLESRNKMSKASKGKTHAEEWKKNHSDKMKGENNPMKGKSLFDLVSAEKSKEMKDNLRIKFSGENNPNYGKIGEESIFSKKVLCVETNTIYGGVRQAARELNLKRHCSISLCCLGKRKSAYGYTWKHIDL